MSRRSVAWRFRGAIAPEKTRASPPHPLFFFLRVNPPLSPAFPGRKATRSEGTEGVGLGRGKGDGLRGGSSASEVHGRRDCPPPGLAPGPEGRESEQAGGGRSRVPRLRREELARQRPHGTGLWTAEAAPWSFAAAFHAILCPSDRLTDRRDRVPPTHPQPSWPTASLYPSLSPDSSFPWCS